MMILLRSEPERNINLHVQDFDPVSLTVQGMSRHVFLEAGRKLRSHVDLSLFNCARISFPCSFQGITFGGVLEGQGSHSLDVGSNPALLLTQ